MAATTALAMSHPPRALESGVASDLPPQSKNTASTLSPSPAINRTPEDVPYRNLFGQPRPDGYVLRCRINPICSMKIFFASALIALALARGAAFAQLEAPGQTAGVNAALTKLFGDLTAFSAKATITVYGKDQKEKISTPMDFALLDNKVRVEIDTAKIRNKDMPAVGAEALKQLGMDRVVSVIRPDTRANFIIFPGLQCYVKTTLSKEEVEAYEKKPKLHKIETGKETLDGHVCVKNRVVVTDDKGGKQEATIWNATDLKDFPVQIMTKEKEDTVVIRYRQIQLAKPDAKSYDAPVGFQEYSSVEALMAGLTAKLLGGGEPAAK